MPAKSCFNLAIAFPLLFYLKKGMVLYPSMEILMRTQDIFIVFCDYSWRWLLISFLVKLRGKLCKAVFFSSDCCVCYLRLSLGQLSSHHALASLVLCSPLRAAV